jgi:hypothetical protein
MAMAYTISLWEQRMHQGFLFFQCGSPRRSILKGFTHKPHLEEQWSPGWTVNQEPVMKQLYQDLVTPPTAFYFCF